jgi:uncharacterized protein YcaQ
MRFHVRDMRQNWQRRVVWFDKVSNVDLRRALSRIRRDGPLTIRDIDNDALVEKDYAWGLDAIPAPAREQVHILSPFDPPIIQRKRLRLFFDYEYRFEAYVPKHQRLFGYFVCPVLIGDRIVAGLDLKTDRQRQKLLVQRWNWVGRASRAHRQQVEAALHEFERFQLCR